MSGATLKKFDQDPIITLISVTTIIKITIYLLLLFIKLSSHLFITFIVSYLYFYFYYSVLRSTCLVLTEATSS